MGPPSDLVPGAFQSQQETGLEAAWSRHTFTGQKVSSVSVGIWRDQALPEEATGFSFDESHKQICS